MKLFGFFPIFCSSGEFKPSQSLRLLLAFFTHFTLAPGNMQCLEFYQNRESDVFKVEYLSPLTSVLLQVRLKSTTTFVLFQLQFHHSFETQYSVIKVTNAMYRSLD